LVECTVMHRRPLLLNSRHLWFSRFQLCWKKGRCPQVYFVGDNEVSMLLTFFFVLRSSLLRYNQHRQLYLQNRLKTLAKDEQSSLSFIKTHNVGLAIFLSDAISIEDFLSYQNCHCQRQRKVFNVCSPVETPL